MFHPVYLLLAKSSPPEQGVGGERRPQLPLCCWAAAGAGAQSRPLGAGERALWAPPPAGVTSWG